MFFISNRAAGCGAGVFLSTADSVRVQLEAPTFLRNVAHQLGGALYVDESDGLIIVEEGLFVDKYVIKPDMISSAR